MLGWIVRPLKTNLILILSVIPLSEDQEFIPENRGISNPRMGFSQLRAESLRLTFN
jgi:hypothetical protein